MTTRRKFIQSSASGILAGISLIHSKSFGANDRIRIGVIGCGGRGRYLIDEVTKCRETNPVEITAVCDVWKPNRERASEHIHKIYEKIPFQTSRYQDILQHNEVDAVIIATPDFAHSPILADAARAHKDAYCEKPMANRLEDARAAVDAVRENKVIVQVGTQRRSEGPYRAAAQMVQSGILGKVTRIDTVWNDSNPRWLRPIDDVREEDVDWEQYQMSLTRRDFDPKRYRRWQLYKDYTTGLPGFLGSHLTDVAVWFMQDPFPLTGMCCGGKFVWSDDREHCDTVECLWHYPKDFILRYSSNLSNNRPVPEMTVMGTEGSFDSNTWTFSSLGGCNKTKPIQDIKVEPLSSESHMMNFLNCIRTRKDPNATVEDGYAHSITSIMAYESWIQGAVIHYDHKQRVVYRT